MHFINPKIDFAFKKIFGDDQHKDILISFLNAILYPKQPQIQSLQIIDPYNAPKLSGLKDTFLDVRARLLDGSQVIIEMQMYPVAGFGKRVLYNIAKAYSAQLRPADKYATLNPVIGLTITDFEMFESENIPDVTSHFVLYNEKNKFAYPDNDITLVFVELPKFTKKLAELKTATDKWLYFMRYASELEEVPDSLRNEPAVAQAFTVANWVNLTQEELDALEKRNFFVYEVTSIVERARQAEEERRKAKQDLRNAQDAVIEAKREAEEEKRKAEEEKRKAEEEKRKAEEEKRKAEEEKRKAEEEKRKAEEAEQKAQSGLKDSINAIAKQLLDLLDDEIISQKTGLTVDEVRQLRE